tara:strand:+ start:245 stop:472 length:228 start_codon:yes stop_codon:yes gene_type:complete
MIYKILLLSVLGLSLSFARTSGKFPTPEDFLSAKNSPHAKKEFTQGSGESEQSVKWKRRHKRRKKDKNRRKQRGR